MGFFSSPNVFSSRQKIKEALFKVQSLDARQRAVVFEALVKELDGGGVTRDEIKRVVRELRQAGEISEIDRQQLLGLL